MKFFSTSALLLVLATPAYARIRAGRRLQDPAPAAPAAPAEAAAAPAAVAPVQKELPACKENFPPAKYEKSGADPFSFEAHKEAVSAQQRHAFVQMRRLPAHLRA